MSIRRRSSRTARVNEHQYWVPMRSRHTNKVWVEGPYDWQAAKRHRQSALAQLEGVAEICIPILAESKAAALERARKMLPRNEQRQK